jgi:hypothetical protein
VGEGLFSRLKRRAPTDLAGQNPLDTYCSLCDVFQYATGIMTSPADSESSARLLQRLPERAPRKPT